MMPKVKPGDWVRLADGSNVYVVAVDWDGLIISGWAGKKTARAPIDLVEAVIDPPMVTP